MNINDYRCTWQVDALYRLLLKYKAQACLIRSNIIIDKYIIEVNCKYPESNSVWTHKIILETIDEFRYT